MHTPRQLHLILFALFTLMLFGAACGAGGGGMPSAAPPADAMRGAMMEAAPAAATAVAGDASSTTWQRSQIRSNTVRLSVGDRETLPLVGMQMNVAVEGFRARVVLDCYFRNDRDSRYEGTFQLRLPNEASPYYFAFGKINAVAADPPPYFDRDAAVKLDLSPARIREDRAASWTEPQEARMVPREKAALAYAQTVRRSVDPGLVEWSGAGVFSARVFPLTQRALHRIVIGYDMDLLTVGDDLEAAIDLPENAPSTVVDLSVVGPPNAAVEVSPKATAATSGGRSRYRFENATDRSITVRFKKPGPSALTFTDPRTGPYFALNLRPDLAAPKGGGDAQGPDAAVFMVDTSLSSNPDRFNIWLKLLSAILDNNRTTMKRFAVMFFNVEALFYKPDFIENTQENVAALLAFAKTLSLKGATDLGAALGQAAQPPWLSAQAPSAWDVFMLSDGASTWGEGDAFALGKKLGGGRARALYAYQTGLSGTDTGVLANLTRESGGAMFSVVGEAEVQKASTAHRVRPYQLVRAEITGGSDLLIAGRPRAVFPGQNLRIVGRGALAAGAEVALTVARDGKERVIKQKLGAPLTSPLAPRAYGQIAVDQLEELGEKTESLATSYSTYFRVTGKTCSLLLLENEGEYQRHGVRPEDPAMIQQSAAAEAFARAQKELGDALGDPKASFFAWLDGLGRAPGMQISVPPALRETLTKLPAATFSVDAAPVSAKIDDARQIPGEFLGLLAKHQIEYDPVTIEASRRLKAAGAGDALKALSSLVEESPGDSVLARDVAFSAMQWGFGGQAYHLFRRVAASRPFEPQTYRAMASCLVGMNRIDLAIAYFEVGLLGRWDARFGDFHRILGMEYLHLLRRIAAGAAQTSLRDYAMGRLGQIGKELGDAQADLVVMITWNTDNTDVDLHVTEPTGEECYYGHRETNMGGNLTQDVTQGFGPEMYVLPRAKGGRYMIRAHYFASDRNRASARTKVQALVFEDWGTPKERVTEKLVTLEIGKEQHDIAVVSR